MSALLAALGFMLLIVLHELGHFSAAKAVGMRVERFSLFFPPLLLRKKVGETEYAIGAVPLGGYVKISGMNPSEELPDEVRTRAYYAQPVWKRLVVIAAGPAVNIVLAIVLFVVFFWLVGGTTGTERVGSIQEGSPASTALEPGDRLIAVDGERGDPGELSLAIAEHTCPDEPPEDGCRASRPASLLVERDGERVRVTLTPVYDADVNRTRVGFTYAQGPRETLPFGQAAELAIERVWFVARETVKLPAYILDPERRDDISGVIGTYEVTRQTIIDDIGDGVAILALVSIALGVINLFPFLPLDGGHIFWGLVEKVRRRPVSYATMERSGVVGIMILVPLILLGGFNDVGQILGEGFDVR
ncbi:MAG TPA: M50 family metallopeptidase [Thermoleophilaceae bacterium]|nr:M50 family metallopeptidase [Thermoleophilaceae bacterium]